MRRFTLIATGAVLLVGATALTYTYRDTLGLTGPTTEEQVENVRAFAKLYGYVRYFHPSDAAAETDWDKFAIYGVREVKDAASQAELRSDLRTLFRPIAPTVQLYWTGTEPPPPADVLVPSDTAGLSLVAWQHRGVEFEPENIPRRHRPTYAPSNLYRSIRLNRPPGRNPLFDAHPRPGANVVTALGRGLSAQVPLALYSSGEQTLRPESAPSPNALRDTLDRVEAPVANTDEALRLANVTIAWNVFQHFYPYFEFVDTDWKKVLGRSLHRALSDTSRRDFLNTLRQMVAQLDDGHGDIRNPTLPSRGNVGLRFRQVGGQVVVIDTAKTTRNPLCPQIGDVVVSIDGVAVSERLRDAKQYISGSPQWKEYQALQNLGRGKMGTDAHLVLRRKGNRLECQTPRARRFNGPNRPTTRPAPIATLSGGVGYVDLTRAPWPEIRAQLDTLSQTKAVIFDLRGYPKDGNYKILGHLASDSLQQMRLEIPQLIYPDQENLAGYASVQSTSPPREPRLTGAVAFLTNAQARSEPEDILAVVKHHDLGTIVGQPTAGANGSVNPFLLPGQYEVTWTGMRVRKHDGSQHHLVGIRPDVRAERTMDGVRSGTDEVLQKALDVIGPADTTSANH